MKTPALFAVMAAFLTIFSARADAQQLSLQIQNGLVTLDAQNVSVRQILAEWARIGGARIVNGEKVMGGPVTLQLNAVPERQALDTVLRGVSGYMLASRQDAASGASQFDRILIMPTSSAPRPAQTAGTPGFAPRQMPPQPVPAPEPVDAELVQDDDHDEEPVDPGDPEGEPADEPEEMQPPQGMPPRFQRAPTFPNPMGAAQPFTPQPYPGAPPQPVQQTDEDPATQPPTSPLNVPPGASSTPGVIAPVPQDPQAPNQRRRPPR